MDDNWRRILKKIIEKLARDLDESKKQLHDLKERFDEAASGTPANPSMVRAKRPRGRITCDEILHTVVVVARMDKYIAWIENHEFAVDLGTGDTLRALLLSLADRTIGDDHGDGLIPVKRPRELIPLLMRNGLDHEIDGGALRAHVRRLRDEFERQGLDRGLIETVRDGYRLRLAEDGQVLERDETV